MNLRTQLSSGTDMTVFLAGKQITLLSPSTTLNLACTSLMNWKYQKTQKISHRKIGKNEFDLEFKNKIEEEIDSVLELNQNGGVLLLVKLQALALIV